MVRPGRREEAGRKMRRTARGIELAVRTLRPERQREHREEGRERRHQGWQAPKINAGKRQDGGMCSSRREGEEARGTFPLPGFFLDDPEN